MAAESPVGRGARMEYGRFLAYSVTKDPKVIEGREVVTKGIAIRVGKGGDAAVLFDTDTMRFAAGWTGGFVDISKTHLVQAKGSACASIAGDIQWQTRDGPGWADERGSFEDPRKNSWGGPLPREWARYGGMYVNGDRVTLSYTVGKTEVLESPWAVEAEGHVVFVRTIRVRAAGRELKLLACEGTNAAVIGGPDGVRVDRADGRQIVTIPAREKAALFAVAMWRGDLDLAKVSEAVRAAREPAEPEAFGPPRWVPEIETVGQVSPEAGPYVVDTLTLPDKNPWDAWMRLTALDFFADGKRAAVATWNGDVWIVSGIDQGLQHLRWKRFASGLFEGLGLRVVGDEIYVLERSQITWLRDLNGDGEADFYQNFNNDCPVHATYHDFAYDLQTDSKGDFYYIRTGHRVPEDWPFHGCVLKVSKNGEKTEVVAGGLRAANGLMIGPHDEMTCADNQGNWVPTSRINWVIPGGFYGFMTHPHQPVKPTAPGDPLCWIPYDWDNSSGSQVWVNGGKWGPYEGKLLHLSYGKSTLFAVFPQQVGDKMQAGVFPTPLKFASGIMRGRFNRADGQLYVCGLKGWQTNGGMDGALQRVRYTNTPVYWPVDSRVEKQGIRLTFGVPLDPKFAEDVDRWSAERWQYKWSEAYGSPEFSVAEPGKKGRDEVEVKSVKLSADRKSVLVDLADLKPVMQLGVSWKIKAADGKPVDGTVVHTVNALPN
jgi:glucose/arabinose dehydrogenase